MTSPYRGIYEAPVASLGKDIYMWSSLEHAYTMLKSLLPEFDPCAMKGSPV